MSSEGLHSSINRSAESGDSRPAVFLMTNTLETGGSERQFVTMANALDRQQFRVAVGCLRAFGPFVSEISGLKEFPVGGSLYGLRSWRSRLALSRLLKGQGVAVAQGFDFYSNLMLIPAARYAGVPAIFGSQRQLGDLLTSRQFHIQNLMFRACDRIVCNSQAAARRLADAGLSEHNLVVIANGLPEHLFASSPPVLTPDAHVVRIGMISRMNHRAKRHDILLRVARRLTEKCPAVQIVFVGDGPLKPELENLARELGLWERVLFLGDRRDIPAVLASLDISVLPSTSESLSNVIMEAMAAGKPVIAANVGGNSELIQHGKTGLLFAPGHEDEFASALATLVTNPELRREFGANAQSRAKREYAVTTIRDRYQELYLTVLEEKGWRKPTELQFRAAEPSGQGTPS